MRRTVLIPCGLLIVLVAGCLSEPGTEDQEGLVSAGDGVVMDGDYRVADHVVELEGNTGVETCLGVLVCLGQSLQPGNNDWFMFGENGSIPEAVELTLEWSAANAATVELVVEVNRGQSCGQGCFSYDGSNVRQFRGESPLKVLDDPIEWDDGDGLLLVEVLHDPVAADPPFVWTHAELDQEFSIHGIVRTRVAA